MCISDSEVLHRVDRRQRHMCIRYSFYELLKPTHAHVLVDGRIVVSGGSELVEKIDQQGYDWIEQEYDVQVVREEEKKVELLGSCGASRGA